MSESESIKKCPNAEEKNPPLEDQAVDKVTIQCSHGGRTLNPHEQIGLVPDLSGAESEPESSEVISFSSVVKSMYKDAQKAMSNKSVDEMTITCTGPNTPASLSVSPKIGEVTGGGTFKVPTQFENIVVPSGGISLVPMLKFFKELGIYCASQTQEYSITGLPPGTGSSSLSIVVYNPHQWEVKVTFPPLFSKVKNVNKKAGHKWTGVGKGTFGGSFKDKSKSTYRESSNSTSVKDGYGKSTYTSTDSDKTITTKRDGAGDRKVQITSTSESVSQQSVFQAGQSTSEKASQTTNLGTGKSVTTVKDSGSEVQGHKYFTAVKSGKLYEVDLAETIEFFKNVIYVFQSLKDIFSSVQVGAYMDLELKACLEGEITANFGYKEHTDNRVYFKYVFDVEILLVSLKFEAGVGVSGGEFFTAQLYAYAEGDLKINGKVERKSPPVEGQRESGNDNEISVAGKPTLKVGMGGRVKVAFFISFQIVGTTGIEANCTVTLFGNPEMDLKAEVDFLGVYYTKTSSVGKSGAFGVARKAKRKEQGKEETELEQTAVGESMETKTKGSDPSVEMLLPRKRLGSYRWSDKNKPETKLEDYEILQRITNMLSESTGFFSYKGRIRVVEPPTGIGGKVKPISDGEVAQAILSGINKNGDVDRTIEGINGLLLSIKNKLRDIQGDEKYLEKTDLESFLNNDLPFMLEDNCEILLA